MEGREDELQNNKDVMFSIKLSNMNPCQTNQFENNREFTWINNDKEDQKGQVMENSKCKCYTFQMMPFFCTPWF